MAPTSPNTVHLGRLARLAPYENREILPNQVRCWGSEQSPDFHRGLVEMSFWTAALVTLGT